MISRRINDLESIVVYNPNLLLPQEEATIIFKGLTVQLSKK